MIWIGVDTGVTGAIAFLRPDGMRVFDLPTMPIDGDGMIKNRVHGPGVYRLLMVHAQGEPAAAVVETVDVGSGMGDRRGALQIVTSQHSSFEVVRTTLELVGIKVHPVSARRWKKLFGLAGKSSDAEAPRKARELAAQLYPDLAHDMRLVKAHNKAEAVLIAHWGHKVQGGSEL